MTEIAQLFEKYLLLPSQTPEKSAIACRLTDVAGQLMQENPEAIDRELWFRFLGTTGKSEFLLALGSDAARNQWAELAFRIIRHTGYSLRHMMDQRIEEHPNRVLFKDMSQTVPVDWTYEQIGHHLQEIATCFYLLDPEQPRVAIYTENCLEGACTDLACLMYGIYNTPLSPHFKANVLLPIFNQLKISIALADTEERLEILTKLNGQTDKKFILLSLLPQTARTREIPYLVQECKLISRWDVEATLAKITVPPLNQVATTMFTSGSTGLPKGVSFSLYNIVSKRFARAAAVPKAGEETFLCYLPLFHTFGRYLEMTGAIYWGGTYIFAGNTSAETLLSLFPRMNPSGFISIPLRWQELYERCIDRIGTIEEPGLRQKVVREVVGQRLHWGLSAAGYLDPAVFRFFNDHGIFLNSGFGMTEATGGITMTPPGRYRDFMVGVPLPGVHTRLSEDSELLISGHYIARYLEDARPGELIPYPASPETDTWLATGDVFKVSADGYYQIVDRVKDIYKNNRGQTVAPQTIEKKFNHVPGIKRVFLVGDNRPYNVLLIVPDPADPIYESLKGENLNEYFHQIVMAANNDVAPYERVINFMLIDRDFDAEKGELTPKGSYNRKAIEQSFLPLIEGLYQSSSTRITTDHFTIRIPKWFYRDLSILESDIVYRGSRLINRRTGKSMSVRKVGNNLYEIGSFRYQLLTDLIDLALFTRQPRLWLGNRQLVEFCPVKEGWDLIPEKVSAAIRVNRFRATPSPVIPELPAVRDANLRLVNSQFITLYQTDAATAVSLLEEIGTTLGQCEPRLAMAIRSRLEALAYHPDEEVRCLAYRLILLKAPQSDEITNLPAFVESGLTFLNERSISEIASSNFGKHRLDALKRRLYWYRTNLRWPAGRKRRQAFADVLTMLFNFAGANLDYYVPVRAELSRWSLHKQDPWLSALAEELFNRLATVFEQYVDKNTTSSSLSEWRSKVVFEHGISDREKQRMLKIFQTTTFLRESILLTFNDKEFGLQEVPENGIWVLRLLSFKEFKHYRLSINTLSERHYDLHLVMSENPGFRPRPDTFYWLASLAGFPHGPAVAPLLGSSRPGLGILTTQYIGGLTAWDKIRELAEIDKSTGNITEQAWRKIFIRSFSIVFKAWHHSGFQIIPGHISPTNIALPELDFKESAVVLSLAGWSEYKTPLSLVEPMLRDFYSKISSIYPWCRKQLDVRWIFDAAIEALGMEMAIGFLNGLRLDLEKRAVCCFDGQSLLQILDGYLSVSVNRYYLPVALFSAIEQYIDWYRMNPLAAPGGREQTIQELIELYRLDQYATVVRYHFYRHTYFRGADQSIAEPFDKLLARMQEDPGLLPIQLVELSDIQSAITQPEEKNLFGRMVFPRHLGEEPVDFLKVGEQTEHIVVRFNLIDKAGRRYVQRAPIEPRETGQLYQLFFREKYPKEISNFDHQHVVTDEQNRIIGGLTYRFIEGNNVLLDGMVVTASHQGRGIASAMIRNFFTAMAARKVSVVKAHFLFGNYFLRNFFEVDKKWGALIKTLN